MVPAGSMARPGATPKVTDAVVVDGPAMTKLLKSNLNWHIDVEQGQIRALQRPDVGVEVLSKYVQFSADEDPHPTVTKDE